MRSRREISLWLRPFLASALTYWMYFVTLGGRPCGPPSLRARAMPALTRSPGYQFKLRVLRRTAKRGLCGVHNYAKPLGRSSTLACISAAWDSA